MHHDTDRIRHTTAFVTPVVEHWLEREIAQWVHPMKDRSDDPSHHDVHKNASSLVQFFLMSLFIYRIIKILEGARCLLMVRWVIGWIPHGGPIELFLVPVSAP